jgi:hypothetical protein
MQQHFMVSFPAFRFGVILDPWMFSLKEELYLPSTVKQPLLFINTETFHTAPNFHAVKQYTDTTPDGCGKRTVFTLRCVASAQSVAVTDRDHRHVPVDISTCPLQPTRFPLFLLAIFLSVLY